MGVKVGADEGPGVGITVGIELVGRTDIVGSEEGIEDGGDEGMGEVGATVGCGDVVGIGDEVGKEDGSGEGTGDG